MAATLVQKAQNSNAAVSANTSIGSGQGWAAPTAGNILVAWANSDISVTLSGWTAGPSVVDNNAAYTWYKTAAGTETTVTFTHAANNTTVGVLEYSGIGSPRDVQNTASLTGTQASSTPSVSATGTSSTGDLWICVAGLHNGAVPNTPTWTNSFVNQQTVTAGAASTVNAAAFVADFQNTSAATVSTVASWSGGTLGNRQALLLAFPISAVSAPTGGTPQVSLVGSTGIFNNTAGSFGPISAPGTLLPGDFVVATIVQNQTTAVTFTGAGWNTLSSAVNSTGLYAPLVLYKVWANGDVMPTVTSSTGKWAYSTIAFRSDSGLMALDTSAVGTGQTTAGTTLAPPAVTSTHAGSVSIVAFAGRNSTAVATANTTTPPTNWTEGTTPSQSDASTNAGTTAALQQVSVAMAYRLAQTGTITPGTATFSQSSFHTGYHITAYPVPLPLFQGWGAHVNL